MKEALQLVDRQRQMNALADAIYSAGDAISNTISEGFSAMQASLSVHFENLSTQIGRVESGIEEIGIQNAANAAMISTQISELMQANEIQSAFMEKASRGVDKLVEDMRKSDWELKVKIEQ